MAISSVDSYLIGAKGSSDKLKAQFGANAKLEKAKIIVLGANDKPEKEVKVQFNPSEYSIARRASFAEMGGFGRDVRKGGHQAVRGHLAQLSVTLYFDSVTDLDKEAFSSVRGLAGSISPSLSGKSRDDVRDVCKEITDLIKYAREEHKPREVLFSWGSLSFRGNITQNTLTYTMFRADGTPVRAKMALGLYGEESDVLAKTAQQPFESPDRTKQRTLAQGDELWMLAYAEYSDPAMWKVIARENGILNPRKAGRSAGLRLPAVK